MKNEIKLVQVPVITHELIKAGLTVTNRLSELNIDNQIATIETVKSLKILRAELNKELTDYEDQRKSIKTGIAKPYNEFESLYKSEISEKYKEAIDKLKVKISSVEIKIKEEKEGNLKIYFIELCQSEDIDFLIFDNVGLEINLSTTEKAYKDKCNEFITRVRNDIDLIKTLDYEAEIMTEYKQTNFNASGAIKTVKDRKESERQEAVRIKQVQWNSRKNQFKNIGMELDEQTKTFQYNDEIYTSSENLKYVSKEDFANKIIEFEEKIKEFNKQKEKPVAKQQTINMSVAPEPEKPVTKKKTPEPLPKPKVEKKLEIVTAAFEVKGTLPQLKLLGQYMKTNNITYKNI